MHNSLFDKTPPNKPNGNKGPQSDNLSLETDVLKNGQFFQFHRGKFSRLFCIKLHLSGSGAVPVIKHINISVT